MDETPPATFEEQLRLARDPATPIATLEAVAAQFTVLGYVLVGLDGGPEPEPGRDPRDIWRALAANPSTPPRLLARLAVTLPDEFCANPAAPLLVLEEPRFSIWVGDEQGGDAGNLLRCADAPAPLVAALSRMAKDKNLREEASLHVAVAGQVAPGEPWWEDVRKIVRRHARALRGDNRQHLLDLIEAGVAPEWLVDAAALAEPPPAPDLSGVWGKPPRNPAAADPDAPAALLLKLAGQRNRGLDRALIENPATPPRRCWTSWSTSRRTRRAVSSPRGPTCPRSWSRNSWSTTTPSGAACCAAAGTAPAATVGPRACATRPPAPPPAATPNRCCTSWHWPACPRSSPNRPRGGGGRRCPTTARGTPAGCAASASRTRRA
jgi:hypothetical protein